MLTISWVLVKFFFTRIGPWATKPISAGSELPPESLQQELRQGISIAARNLPWKCVCLPRVVAGKMFLARRGFGSMIRLGVDVKGGALSAHAWLEVGTEILIGARGAKDLSILI